MKTLIRLLCAGLALLIVAGTGLYFYLTPERLRALIVPRLSESLDRKVGIEALSLSLWGGVSAVADGVTIQERPGFGSLPFVSARRMDIAIPILPLLTGEGRLGRITIESPSLSLLVNEAGESNFADLMEPDSTSGASSSPVVPISHVVLSDAALTYSDQSQDTQHAVEGLDLDVEADLDGASLLLQGTAAVDELSVQSERDAAPFRTGALSTGFLIALDSDRLEIRELDLRKNGFALSAKGSVDLATQPAALDLRMTSSRASLAELLAWLAPGTAIDGLASLDLHLDTTPDPSASVLQLLRGTVTLENLDGRVAGLPHPLTSGSTTLKLEPDRLRIEKFAATTSGSRFEIEGHVDRWWMFDAPVFPKATLKIRVDSLNTGRFLAEEPTAWWHALTPGSPVSAAYTSPPDLGWTSTVDLDLSLDTDRVRHDDLLLERVSARARIAGGTVRFREMRLETHGAKLDVSGSLDLRNAQFYGVSAEGTIRDIDLAAFPQLLAPGSTLGGRAEVALTTTARLDPFLGLPFASPSGRLDNPRLRGRATLSNVRFTSPDLGVPMEIPSVDLEIDGDRISTKKLETRGGKSHFLISGAVEGYLAYLLHDQTVRPRMQIMVGSTYCDMDELLPVPPPPPAPQSASTWSFVAPAHAATPPIDETSLVIPIVHHADGTAIIDFTTLVTDSITISNLQARANTNGGKLEVKPLEARAYDGWISGFFTLDASRSKGPYPVSSQLDVVDVEVNTMLTHALGELTPMYGKINLKVGMKGAVDSVLTIVRKELNAQGGMGMQKGRIQNWGWLKDALKDVQQLGFFNFDEIPVKTLQAPFRIQDERVHFDQFTLVASDMTCKVTGSSGFDGSINAILDIWVPARHLNLGGINVGNALSGLFGKSDRRIPMRVSFSGTSEKPKVAVDVQPEGWEQFDRKVQETEEKLYKDAENMLKKWWNED